MDTLFLIGLEKGDARSLQVLEREELAGVSACLWEALPPFLTKQIQERGLRVINLEEALPGSQGFSLQEVRTQTAAFILKTLKKEGLLAYFVAGAPQLVPGLEKYLYQETQHEKICIKTVGGSGSNGTWYSLLDFLSRKSEISFSAGGLTLIDAYSLDELREPLRGDLLISSACNRLVPQIKVELLKIYPPGQKVTILQFNAAGEPFLCDCRPLVKIDEHTRWHAPTFFYLSPSDYYALGDLLRLIGLLRSATGCPWDREQNHKTLRPYLVEEAYEVLDAIDGGDPRELCEELGDLLLQIVFHSRIAAEEGRFNIWQVIEGITTKILRRHPHVFGEEKAEDIHEVGLKWQEIKQQEKKGAKKGGILSVPAGMPALMKAQKVQKKAATVGFDWPDIKGPLEKFWEETREFQDAYYLGDQEKMEEEMGDLLFALVNIARFLEIEAEFALSRCLEKFKRRFGYLEEQVERSGTGFASFSLEELDRWWEEAKGEEKKGNL